LAKSARRYSARLPARGLRIVTDETVARLHLHRLKESLRKTAIDHTVITVAPGEESKSFATLTRVVDEIIAARIERNDVVLALGGGVVGDLAGFCGGSRAPRRAARAGADDASGAGRFLGRGKTGINSPRART